MTTTCPIHSTFNSICDDCVAANFNKQRMGTLYWSHASDISKWPEMYPATPNLPDGSFMMSAFIKGWDAAVRASRKGKDK